MGADTRPSFKEICRACGQIAIDRLTATAAILLLLGWAGGDSLKDLLLGKVSLMVAWTAFVTNLGTLLDNGLVRFGLVCLGLFLLSGSATRVARNQRARDQRAAAARQAVINNDNATRREMVGEVQRLIEGALATITEDVRKARANSIILANVSESGRKLAAVELILVEAQQEFGAYQEAVPNLDSAPGQAGEIGYPITAKGAVVRGFTALGEPPPQIMLGNPTTVEQHRVAIQKIGGKKQELEAKVAELRTQHAVAIIALQGVS